MSAIALNDFPEPETVDCPDCKTEIILHDPAGSEYCVCPGCSSLIRFTPGDIPLIQKQAPKPKLNPVLAIGDTGTFDGHRFKVIAYMEKKEKGTTYSWREYLLYNYEKGYATFAEYDGHWNFVAGKEFYPELSNLKDHNLDAITFQNRQFRLFNKYTVVLTGRAGESDWDPLHEVIKTAEFITPPGILFKEKDQNRNVAFYLGRYAEPEEVAEAFGKDIAVFPSRVGIGANQLSIHQKRWNAVYEPALIGILVTALIALLTIFFKPSTTVLSGNFGLDTDTTKAETFKPFTTPSFELTDASSSLDFHIEANIDNNWAESTVVLVNEQDNQTWEVTESIEYYYGYEDGERWSEGSRDAKVLISAIPAGKYHLNIYPASGNTLQNTMRITVTANTLIWRNLLATIMLLALYPAYLWYRMRNYEKQRWMSSDHSPSY
ncbi:DUF4178 domain-containing protein [Pedobacter sp. JY14-1]|uniref:DUF4178 domain-containing protein n=1 Tax=Pedobacter sp. JY14-1 TaxID=3034151 RepID=UPI0023E116EB|nr:DUF4178 domain-containing protein [Pedobacter sp. JY14-1]